MGGVKIDYSDDYDRYNDMQQNFLCLAYSIDWKYKYMESDVYN